jgi:hypothetical protein
MLSIPHDELLKAVARRIVDWHVLRLIKLRLKAPIEERDEPEVVGALSKTAFDPNVWSGRALRVDFSELAVSSLASMYPAFDWNVWCSGPSWISARVRSHCRTGLERAIRVTSVRKRQEDRTSISSHPLADLAR